ncbi:MAG TPA: hypothetical protein VGD80_28185 [Kofleriaceae bacterium]
MVEVLERGDISFFYRPRVQPADAPVAPMTRPGVQSFFVVLSTAHGTHRRIRIGRKRMPVRSGERLWARVERVGSMQRVLADQLESEEYTTKTRGERYQPGARSLGRGCYAFARHDDHIHFAYRVDLLESDMPDDVTIPDAGSDVVLFEGDPQGSATWTTEGTPSLLDDEGAELVLVGVAGDPEHDLGIDVLATDDLQSDANELRTSH